MTQLLEVLKDMLCDIQIADISFSEIPVGGGIYAEISGDRNETVYYDKKGIHEHTVIFYCKNTNQKYCIDTLVAICNYFNRLKKYKQCDIFQILNINANSLKRIGQLEDGQFLYTCILNCKLYY